MTEPDTPKFKIGDIILTAISILAMSVTILGMLAMLAIVMFPQVVNIFFSN
jgi:hypothetical protein